MVGAGGSVQVWCGSGVVRVRRGQDKAALRPLSSTQCLLEREWKLHTRALVRSLTLPTLGSAVLVLGRGMYRRALMGTRWVTGEPDMMLLHA
jgi:hypothetical protein